MRLLRSFPLIFLSFAAMLTSCANVPADFQFDASKDVGLIVGSITYESSIGLYALAVVGSSEATSTVRPKIDVGYSMFPPLGPLYDEALKAKGGMFAVAVPAGNYKIVGWAVRQGAKISGPGQRVDIPFVVERGKASYVGNLHFSPDWEVSLRDRAARDLPALSAKYDALKKAPLAYTIAQDTDLRGIGGEYQSRFDYSSVPIFVPVKR